MTELTTPIKIDIPGVGSIESPDLYLKSEVDKLLAEKDKKIVELQSKVTLASLAEDCSNLRNKRCNYCSALRRQMVETRKAKHALWKHREIVAKLNKNGCRVLREANPFIGIEEYNWQEVERKCRAMAEKFKETANENT